MSQIYLQNLQIYDDAGVGRDSTGQILRVVTASESSLATAIADQNRTTSGTSISGTLAGVSGKTTYVRGFRITAAPIAVAVSGEVTLSGLVSGKTFSYELAVLVGGLAQVWEDFGEMGLPANAANTSIILNVPALTGATVSLNIWGYQK